MITDFAVRPGAAAPSARNRNRSDNASPPTPIAPRRRKLRRDIPSQNRPPRLPLKNVSIPPLLPEPAVRVVTTTLRSRNILRWTIDLFPVKLPTSCPSEKLIPFSALVPRFCWGAWSPCLPARASLQPSSRAVTARSECAPSPISFRSPPPASFRCCWAARRSRSASSLAPASVR